MAYGILIDYQYCTGCHTCEVACKMENDLPTGQFGVKVNELGPYAIDEANDRWQLSYIPNFTDQCNMCSSRTARGKLPACVHSCYTGSMFYGPLDELVKKMEEKPEMVLFRPKNAKL